MGVENISGNLGAHQIQKGYLDAKRKLEPKEKGERLSRSDQVNISDEAKKMAEQETLVQQGKEVLNRSGESEIRNEAVQRAEERVAIGHYESKEVLEKIIEYLIKRNEFINLPSDKDLPIGDISEEEIDIQPDRLNQIQERIDDGFYDRLDVLDTIAQRILGD